MALYIQLLIRRLTLSASSPRRVGGTKECEWWSFWETFFFIWDVKSITIWYWSDGLPALVNMTGNPRLRLVQSVRDHLSRTAFFLQGNNAAGMFCKHWTKRHVGAVVSYELLAHFTHVMITDIHSGVACCYTPKRIRRDDWMFRDQREVCDMPQVTHRKHYRASSASTNYRL